MSWANPFSSIGKAFGFQGSDESSGYDKAINEYNKIDVPDAEDLKIKLQKYVSAGILKPEQAQAILQNPSAFNSISTNPQYDQAEMDALSKLQQIGSEGGLTATDKAKLADISNQENQQERGNREAILQNAAQKGMSNSGINLVAQLQNNQGSASRTNQRDMDVAAMAEQRALDAIMQSGELGAKLEGQDFQKQAEIARANDAINQFNTRNRQDIENMNVGNRNYAQQYNLGNKQNLMNNNTDLANKQTMYNTQAKQQGFNNAMDIAHARTPLYYGQGQAQDAHDRSSANTWGKTIDWIGQQFKPKKPDDEK